MRVQVAVVALAALALAAPAALAQDARQVLSDTGITAGLAVHLGTTDGQLEIGLAEGGRMLVHGLAASDAAVHAARKAILDRGLYGLASVERWPAQDRLPYAADLVNLLVADQAVLAGLKTGDDFAGPVREVMRVLVPGGAAYINRGGTWQAIRKERPKEIDDWTHFDYDCTNNGVSRDARVRPITTLKWIEGYRSLRYGKSASGAFRSWRGVLVHEQKAVEPAGSRPRDTLYLAVRDAFNGIGHWFLPIKSTSASGLQGIVVADGRIFTMANPDDARGPLRAYDLATGREVLRFAEGGLLETEAQAGGSGHAYASGAPRWVRLLYHDGTIYQTANDSLYCLDAATARRRWVYADPEGNRLLFATYAPDVKRVFVAVTERAKAPMPNDWGEWNSRWPASKLISIVALDAASGRPVWRNTDVAGQAASQLVYDAGRLAYFSASGIGAMGNRRDVGMDWTWLGMLDAAGGKLLWSRNYRREKLEAGDGTLGFAFGLVLRGGSAFIASQNHIVEFDSRTGKALRHLAPPIPNSRCCRPRATLRWHIMGFGTFVAEDMDTTVNQNLSRSDCMTGPTPANGMIYHTPNGCTCFAMLRGFAGYGCDAPWAPLPVERRLVRGDGRPPLALVTEVRRIEHPATVPYAARGGGEGQAIRLPRFDGSPIRNAWSSNDVLPYPETEAVAMGDLALVAVVNEHRLEARPSTGSGRAELAEARRSEKVVWSFTAGGRIASPPLVHQGRVYVASHDGLVMCLDGRDGRVVWQFLAAPVHRRIVAYGQLESSWPVCGVVLHQGLIAAAAGRHPELDGGIYLYGLDPGTGQTKWEGRIHTDIEVLKGGSDPQGKPRKWRRPANTIADGRLCIADGKLVLVSRDATNEGVSRPVRLYEVVIDPADPPR